jgi:outer membrane protein OmpA-like peptidoglycan-associated protein
VRAALEARGVEVSDVLAFGQELPVRDDDSPAALAANRRVEIFLR